MIPKRLTEKFTVVCPHDSAINETFDYAELSEYYMSGYDISKLDLTRCKEQPSKFICEPLKSEFHYILDSMEGGLPQNENDMMRLMRGDGQKKKPLIKLSTAWQIFRRHVKDAENYTDNGAPILIWDNKNEIDEKCHPAIDDNTLMFVAVAILLKAGASKAVFTVPDMLLAETTRSAFRIARDAKTDPAKN